MTGRIRIWGLLSWAAGFTVLATVLVTTWMVFFSLKFSLDDMEIRGNCFLTEKDIRDQLGKLPLENRPIWVMDFTQAEELLVSNPRVASAEVRREIPNKVTLFVVEETEFATLEFRDGGRVVVNPVGIPIRNLARGESPVGPVIKGFSRIVFLEQQEEILIVDHIEAWTGLTPKPSNAGKLKAGDASDPKSIKREQLRYQDALRLALGTGVNIHPELANYDHIGLDENFDLFIAYSSLPPIVVGGYNDPAGICADIGSILEQTENQEVISYRYIDLHLGGFARGIKTPIDRTMITREWSDCSEAVRVAAWETLGEVERRAAK